MPTAIDIASLNKDAPVIVFKKDTPKKPKKEADEPKAPKKVKPEVIKEEIKEEIVEVKKVKEPVVEVKKVKEPVVEVKEEVKEEIKEKPKRVKLEKGSDLAKQWGLMMKEKRDAKKALKPKEMTDAVPDFM
jgi:hypothetical protein